MSETKRVNHRGVERRQALVAAAIELWSSTGYRGTGITAVAERAGVTPAGLLHHFGTKDAFLLAVVQELDRQTLDGYPGWQAVGGLELLDKLPLMVRTPGERPALWRVLLMLQAENFDADSPAHDYFVARQKVIHSILGDALRRGQAAGELRADADADLVAAQVLAFLLGLQVFREHGPHDVDLVEATADFAARLRRDLAVDPGTGAQPPP
jgi:AcrR family transcriptional regulator